MSATEKVGLVLLGAVLAKSALAMTGVSFTSEARNMVNEAREALDQLEKAVERMERGEPAAGKAKR